MSEARPKPLDPVTLTRIRHDLAAASGKRRLDLILDAENPMAVVRALPADELYFTIGEVGLADAAELVQLASPAQFRVFLDLAAWTPARRCRGSAPRAAGRSAATATTGAGAPSSPGSTSSS